MRFFIIFILLSFSSRESISNPFLNTNPMVNSLPAFNPNFSQPASILPQGTPLIPICSVNSGPVCFNQWTSQSTPLSVGGPIGASGIQPQFQYFTPSFIPYSSISSQSTMSGWRKSATPSSKGKKERRSFYFNTKQPERVRMVEQNEKGETEKVMEGRVFYINLDDIEEVKTEEDVRETEKTKPAPEETPPAQIGTTEETDQEVIQETQANTFSDSPSNPIDTNDLTAQENVQKEITNDPSESITSIQPKRSSEDLNPAQSNQKEDSENSESQTSNTPNYRIARDTIALPAVGGVEVEPGCFRVNKRDIQTESSFCMECIRDIEENKHFRSLLGQNSFLSELKDFLSKTKTSSTAKINSQIAGKLSGDGTTEICSPLKKLKFIIDNFEDTCPPYNQTGGFKKFFGDSLCESCKKGVPIEFMTAMMSIESAGKCTARNTRGENSAGLFQVDSNQHTCKSGYKKGTERNAQCLAQINNNWNKSIDILNNFYKKTNGRDVKKPCKDWIDMESENRDAFRRALSGYNGGTWLLSSIRAAKNNNRNDSGIGRYKIATDYKHDKSTWEEIRAFFFTQQIRSDGFSKRSIKNNISNLAHTEAILGREVRNSVPGMIEIWSQYKREFLKDNPTQCQ